MERYKEIRISDDLHGQVVLDYQKDVTYISNDGEDLHLQMIIPSRINESAPKRYPLVLYLMAKVEEKKDINRNIPRLTQLAKRGFVIALMETPEKHASYQKQMELSKLAIQYLVQNAKVYPIATENMFILRDAYQEQKLEEEMFQEKISLQEKELNYKIRAVICLGGKEQMGILEKKIDCSIPPVLMLSADGKNEDHLEFWTEETIDMMEDFMSSYIE